VIELRNLRLRDLAAIERIERRSYPTPWSRSMFAGELTKSSSVCLGAYDGDTNALVGYLIISRYVDGGRAPRVHTRGAGLEQLGHPPLREARLQGARGPAWLLHRQS
jgi:hypothetical protein